MNTMRIMKRANHATLAGAALFVGALSATPAIAGGLILYEVGTEDVGLAAAGYAARAQDATTVFTNPAGMTRLEGNQFQLGTQVLYSNTKFSNGGSSPQLGTGNGGKMVGDSGWFPGGNMFMSYSLSPDVKLGFAVVGNTGLSLKYDDNWVGRYYVQQATLMAASFLPSIAYRVNDKLSVGASVNAMYGYLKSVTGINNIAPGAADGKLVVRDTQWGWGGNLGVLYEATKGTRFGLTYSSEVKLDFSAPTQFSGLAPGLSTVLNNRGLLNANVDLGVNIPQQLMGSAFHTINDRWAVLGNIGWQQWSRFGQVQVGVDSNNPTNLTTSVPFKDTWHAAIGAQHRLSDPWRLNFGVAYDTGFQPNGSTVSPLLPTNTTLRLGAGVQNQVSKTFSWGIAGEYGVGGTLNVNKQGADPTIGGRGNLVGSYDDIRNYFVSANFNWKL